MAKKQKQTKVEVEEPQIQEETVVVEQPKAKVVEKPQVTKYPEKVDWEIKERVYYLVGRKKPVSRTVKSANIYYFDEEKGYERELK